MGNSANHKQTDLTHSFLEIYLTSVIWSYHTFENNLERARKSSSQVRPRHEINKQSSNTSNNKATSGCHRHLILSTCDYSLSDSSLAIAFSIFLWQNVRVCHPTWQTTLEHYYVYLQTYFLSQHRKMLILLISSCCKMCTLPTIRSRAFVCCVQYKHARLYCWQWPSFTMGSNE